MTFTKQISPVQAKYKYIYVCMCIVYSYFRTGKEECSSSIQSKL